MRKKAIKNFWYDACERTSEIVYEEMDYELEERVSLNVIRNRDRRRNEALGWRGGNRNIQVLLGVHEGRSV